MIVVPALHPAREITALIERLEPGQVHRAVTTLDAVGGKAINVARFVRQMGSPVRLIVLADNALAAMLREDRDLGRGDSPPLELVPSLVPSRTDLTLLDGSGSATVINGTAADPGRAAVADAVARTTDALAAGDVLVLAGSLPLGTSGVLDGLIRAARARGALVIVDASGEWLVEALAASPDVVKINEHEARAIERSLAPVAHRDAEGSVRTPRRVGGADRPPWLSGAPILAITDGARGLRAWIGPERWRILPPPDQPVLSPVGAGDAVTAGLALALGAGRDPIDALVLGTAMAAASLRHLECRLDPGDAAALVPAVVVEPLR